MTDHPTEGARDEREDRVALARQNWIRGRSRAVAQESYTRFRESYEVEHGVVLSEWAALDEGTQARWRQMFVPVAEQLVQADEAVRAARLLEEEHHELRARFDRDGARLAELEDLVSRVSQRLPEAALLSTLPAPLLAALAPLCASWPCPSKARASVPAVYSDAAGAGLPAVAGSPDAGAMAPGSPASATAPRTVVPVSAGLPSTDAAGAGPPAPTDSPNAGTLAPTSPASAAALSDQPPARLLSPELVAELEAAASAFAAEVASIKLPLASETGTQRARARVRANASQALVALHKQARAHLLDILGDRLAANQRASLWPLPDDVFSVAYDVAAILGYLGAVPASPVAPSPMDVPRAGALWMGISTRLELVEARLAAAGLADLDSFTDVQLGQVGGIVAEVLCLDVNPAGLASLGGACVAFTRAFESVRRTTG